MLKVVKFGGSSCADAKQFAKVKSIVQSDPARRVVVVSAPGKRFQEDQKITDLFYLCAAQIKNEAACKNVFKLICSRYSDIAYDCDLSLDLVAEFDALWLKMREGISTEEFVSRGEYYSARLMAEYLKYDFLDASCWLRFCLDGTVDQAASYETLKCMASDRCVVIPGFYGAMPNGNIQTFSRGGSDITGALAAAALNADVYENWTDVSGIFSADPNVDKDSVPIRYATYDELYKLTHSGAQVFHGDAISPVREKRIPINIRNTNDPNHPGTMIIESVEDKYVSYFRPVLQH